jgi:hypothetical protein
VVIEHLVVPLGFAPIPVDRVVKAFRRSILKMYGLPRKGAKASPRKKSHESSSGRSSGLPRNRPVFSARYSRIALESNTRVSPPEPSVSTMAGTLPFGFTFLNQGWCCSPLLVSTGTIS